VFLGDHPLRGHGLPKLFAKDRHLNHCLESLVVLDSVTSIGLQSALDGLSLRNRTIANNVANVNTPNFKASRVAFENSLAAAVKTGSKNITAATSSFSLEPTQLNGNNVNLETETISQIDTQLRYSFASQAIGVEGREISAAIGR
jgi:flagellar basal-body rod protein FlgB